MFASRIYYGERDAIVVMPETGRLEPEELAARSPLCTATYGNRIHFVHPLAPTPEGIFRGTVLGYCSNGSVMCIELSDGYAELDMRRQKDLIVAIYNEGELLWNETL